MTPVLAAEIFQEPIATKMEIQRAKARQKRRIIYDCLNAELNNKGVSCKLHIITMMNNENYMPAIKAFKGVTPKVCQDCPDYRIDEEIK